MSLDVYLTKPGVQNIAGPRIFIREDGQTLEITRDEWDRRFPGREPAVVECESDDAEAYSANITHNLSRMADAAGVYEAVWRPESIGITTAAQLIEPLKAGIARLEADPAKFRAFNPSNGWGDYEGLVGWLKRYLAACEASPDATVSVCR